MRITAHERATLAARIEISSSSVSPGADLRYLVINEGDVPIMLGGGYALDRWANDEWTSVPLRLWVAAWGRRLEPEARTDLSFPLPAGLLPGRYRLRKRLDADRDPRAGCESIAGADLAPLEATAEFDVRSE